MNIQQAIEAHRSNYIYFNDIGYPQHMCANDEDYIEYINYCWEYLGLIHKKISKLCFYKINDVDNLNFVYKEIARSHSVIEKCHKFLNKDADYMLKNFPHVYTGKLAQGKI